MAKNKLIQKYEHLWREDEDGNPLVAEMSLETYNRIPPYTGSHPVDQNAGLVSIPRMGWVPLGQGANIMPQAASEAAQAQAQELEAMKRAIEERDAKIAALNAEVEAKGQAQDPEEELIKKVTRRGAKK